MRKWWKQRNQFPLTLSLKVPSGSQKKWMPLEHDCALLSLELVSVNILHVVMSLEDVTGMFSELPKKNGEAVCAVFFILYSVKMLSILTARLKYIVVFFQFDI